MTCSQWLQIFSKEEFIFSCKYVLEDIIETFILCSIAKKERKYTTKMTKIDDVQLTRQACTFLSNINFIIYQNSE